MWTQIRLLLKEQSDLGPHCLQKLLLKSQADDKQTTIVVIGALRVKMPKKSGQHMCKSKGSSHRAFKSLNRLCISGLLGNFDFIGQRDKRFTVKKQLLQAH